MPQYDREDALYWTTHAGCTTADGFYTDASIIRYRSTDESGTTVDISVQDAIENIKDVSHDFGTY